MYKFIFRERYNILFNLEEYMFFCSLNNKIPYYLTISIIRTSTSFQEGDYILNVKFKSTNANYKPYNKFSDIVETWFYLNEKFDDVFKPNYGEKEPQQISSFLDNDIVRQNLREGLNVILIKTFGV
jgi:hypothetical protein